MPESSPDLEALAGLAEFLEIHAESMWTRQGLTESEYLIGPKPVDAIEVHVICPDDVPELIRQLRLALDFLTEAEPQLAMLEEHDPNNHLHSAYLALRELLSTAIKHVRARRMIRLPKAPQKYNEIIANLVQAQSAQSVKKATPTPASPATKRAVPKDIEMKGRASEVVKAIYTEIENGIGRSLTKILQSSGVSHETFSKSAHFKDARSVWETLKSKREEDEHWRSEQAKNQRFN